MNAETLSVDLKWIAAGKNGVTLNAPKGMGIAGDSLYVADVGGVRKFDRRTGAPTGTIAVPGSCLNDVASDGTNVFVSDTGIAAGPGVAFAPTGTDAIWRISGDKATRIAAGTALNHPNGLTVVDGKLWVASFHGDELYELSDDGKPSNVTHFPKGQLDGLVHLPDGTFVVCSWQGDSIYRGPSGGPFEQVLAGIDSPADIGWDGKRDRLLVPTGASVTVHPIALRQ